MTTKSANVIARVDPEIKKQAEEIINNLGFNVSTVINTLYRQIIIRNAIPFFISNTKMSDEEIIEFEYAKIIKKRIENHELNKDSISFEEVYNELHKKLDEDEKRLQNRILQGNTK